eukprot:Pgem_evm2s19339
MLTLFFKNLFVATVVLTSCYHTTATTQKQFEKQARQILEQKQQQNTLAPNGRPWPGKYTVQFAGLVAEEVKQLRAAEKIDNPTLPPATTAPTRPPYVRPERKPRPPSVERTGLAPDGKPWPPKNSLKMAHFKALEKEKEREKIKQLRKIWQQQFKEGKIDFPLKFDVLSTWGNGLDKQFFSKHMETQGEFY